jgi:hypothetical protein
VELNIRGEMEAAAAQLEEAGADFEGSSEDASPASESESTSEASASPAAEDATPATVETPQAETPAEQPVTEEFELPVGGSIPVPRVRKILENTRAKARAEAQAQLEQLAWAKEKDRAAVEEALRIYEFANQNPVEFYRQVTERLRSDPSLRAEVERLWSPAQQAAEPKKPADEKPQPDVLLEDGRLVYSSDQMDKLMAWQERQFEGKVSAKLEPFEKATRQREQAERINAEATRVYQEALKWPGMADPANRKAVAEAMYTKRIPLDAAYRDVVLPKLTDTKSIEERIRQQVLAELKQKGRATTQNPQKVVSDPVAYSKMSIREVLEATAAELGMGDDE